MKHCKTHHKKYSRHKLGGCYTINNAKPDGGVILNRVVSLLLTGIEMAIFGQANKNSNIAVKQSANSNINSMPQTNKRKKCSSCNGKNCATCIKI